MSFSYEIPNLYDVWSTVDWIEFYLVCNCVDFSKAEFQDFIENSTGIDVDEQDLGFIDSVWDEIENREKLYGKNPPFNVEDNVIRCNLATWKFQPHYCMCLIFSLEGNPCVKDYTTAASGTLFEGIIKKATTKFFNGIAYVYGYPNEKLKDFSNRIDTIDYVADLHSDIKDAGMDVLGIGPFNDGRKNDLSIIVQCATGRNWKSKIDDVNIDFWFGGKFLKFPLKPVKGFAIPRIMKPTDIEKESLRFGLLIDRTRIYRCVNSLAHDEFECHIVQWCNSRLEEMLA